MNILVETLALLVTKDIYVGLSDDCSGGKYVKEFGDEPGSIILKESFKNDPGILFHEVVHLCQDIKNNLGGSVPLNLFEIPESVRTAWIEFYGPLYDEEDWDIEVEAVYAGQLKPAELMPLVLEVFATLPHVDEIERVYSDSLLALL